MIDAVWFFMIFFGIVLSLVNGNAESVMSSAIKGAESAVGLTIGLIGVICIWCGIMKIAEKSGLTALIGRALMPFMRLVFPDIPPGHPAMGFIIMNLSSNMLGLSNAATPFGIKAMQEMKRADQNGKRASDSMVMFLVVNSTCIQLVPSTVISIRAAAGSRNPSEIILPTILSTLAAAIFGVLSCKLLRRHYE